ncbi:MAG: hypothetical protein EAX96_12170 [Candidatus Lokiarchaeota archaeon]|nr:hypothetical protein [Candidatus Lokiarchaeota archaeon]
MNSELLDQKLKKMTYKIGLLSYFIKIFKTELGNDINSDEFSGFLCSGIIPILLSWIEQELLTGSDKEQFTMEQFEEARKIILEKSDLYFS